MMADTDIRWREVYASVRTLDKGLVEFLVDVRWEGSAFVGRMVLSPVFCDDIISYQDILDEMVDKIDEQLEKSGHPPYIIRSK